MAEEALDNLFGTPEADIPPPADTPAPAPAQQAPAPEPVVEAAPAQPEPPPEPEARPDHTVPLAKYLDTRDELKALKAWKAEQEARAQQEAPSQAPDPIDDPNGYNAYLEQRLEQRVTAQKFEMSDVMARETHGAETVDAAQQWALERAKADPVFASQYMRERHPIDWIVRQHKRDAIVTQIPTDVSSLDELIEREVAKRLQTASQPAPAGQTQQASAVPPAPSKSLVDLPSGGGVTAVPIGPTAGFDAVFTR